MLEEKYFNRIAETIPFLKEKSTQLAEEFRRSAFYARIPAGHEVFVEGDHVDGIALLMSGVVRVYKIGETGREITLYRFGEGESCIVTANAILNMQEFPAIAIVEQEAEAVIIPSDVFIRWVRQYDEWLSFVFKLNAMRLTSVLQIVDEVAFQRMDRRIALHLCQLAEGGNPIRTTHQEIANELGSSREVVSRLLADFAGQGLVQLARGEVEILDFAGLDAVSAL